MRVNKLALMIAGTDHPGSNNPTEACNDLDSSQEETSVLFISE